MPKTHADDRHATLREGASIGERTADSPSRVRDAGKYQLLAELGRGGMANVYLAVARGPSGFNKLVVLKCLRSELADDKELLGLFLEEARVSARLNHPHVVQTYEIGDYAGRPVIVMEYLEGQTLMSLAQRARVGNRLSLALHLRVIVDALEGLHYAHELTDFAGKRLDLVHRDVSPQNIFVTFDGQVKVLDFGIAKIVNSHAQTSTGILKGKIHYMAPEQMLCNPVDRRADVYAAGVMAWEAVTGKRMWKDVTDLQVMNKVTDGGAPSAQLENPTVSPALDAIVMKALARNPDDRYSNALEFAAAIESFLEQTGTGVSNRALAKLMRELFEDARAQTRAVVEAQLLEVGNNKDRDSDTRPLIPTNLVRISVRPDESPPRGTGAQTIAGSTADPWFSMRRLAIPVAGAITVASATVALVVWTRGPINAAVPVPISVAVSPADSNVSHAAQPAIAAPPSSVTLTLSASPSRATLRLDGRPLPSNPFAAVVASDEVVHSVRAEASGYLAKTIMVMASHDSDVAVVLEPAAVSRGGIRGSTTAAPAQTVAPPSTVNANSANCNPPYFINARGIKKYRSECL